MHLFNLPHHDGSPLYVSSQTPALGDVVTLWVRVPAGYDARGVHVRTVVDGEPRFLPCVLDPSREGPDTWWRVDLEILNPVQNYRFHVTRPGASPVWLTAAGIVERDLPDGTDFRIVTHQPPPGWSRQAVIYQIFPDRYARSATADARDLPEWAIACDWDSTTVIGEGPGTSEQIFGGDLDGIAEHLDHIESHHLSDARLSGPVQPSL
jgi:alpha-glucosidase